MGFANKLKRHVEGKDWYIKLRYAPVILRTMLFLNPGFAKQLKRQEELYKPLQYFGVGLIFDIGANEGFTTKIFSGMADRVIVVEPSKRNLRVLRARFNGKKEITILPLAVSDRKGKGRFFDNNANYAFSTLDERWRSLQGHEAEFSSYDVELTTIDQLISDHGIPDYIKIDVEGHEESVIRGLTSPVPLLSFEAMLPHYLQQAVSNILYLHALDNSSVFNYAIAEEMRYSKMVSAEQIISDIEKLGDMTIDVFCRSNP